MTKYVAIALAVALIASLGANWHQATTIGKAHTANQKIQRQYAEAKANNEAKARQIEQQRQKAATQANDQYQRGLDDGQATVDDLRKQLASGRLRIHREQANVATSRVSSQTSAKRAASSEARAELSEARVLDLVRLLKEGDDRTRQANALIDAWNKQ